MLSTLLSAVLLCCWPRVRGKLWRACRRCSDTRSYTSARCLANHPSAPALIWLCASISNSYINGLFLLFMESLSEKIKSERIRNRKECAGKQHLVCEPWWTFCSHLLKGKRSTIGYGQWTLNLEALGTSVWFGLYALIFKDSVPWLTVRLGTMLGGRRERGRARSLVVVEPANLKVLLDSVGQHPAQSRHQMKVSSTNQMNECSVLGVPSWTKRRLHYSKAKNISKINPTTSLAYQSFWGKVNRNCDFWFSAENLEEY